MEWVTCIHYPNNYSSKGDGKNDITKATFASSSSWLDFGRQCKDSSISRAAPKAKHEERLIKIWLIAQMRYSLESCCSFGSPFLQNTQIVSFVCFPVSKLGSDWSVCRKCIIHMLLKVILYIYGIVNLSIMTICTWIYMVFDHDSHR